MPGPNKRDPLVEEPIGSPQGTADTPLPMRARAEADAAILAAWEQPRSTLLPSGPQLGPRPLPPLSGPNGPTAPTVELQARTAVGIGAAAVARAGSGEFKINGNDADDLILHRASTTLIVTAVRTNQLALQLAAISWVALLDAKLEQLRDDRSNSEDPAQYEDLKLRVESFLAASSLPNEAFVVATTLSLADGLRNWWTKDHLSICNKTLNIGLFAAGLGICGLAGALGTASVVTVGTLVGGKDIPSALEACVKLLRRD
jgi:hypothetical protein